MSGKINHKNYSWYYYIIIFIKKIKEKISSSYSEYFTIMFIPHSERNIINFKIPRLFIFIFMFIFSTVAIGGFYFYFEGTQAKNVLEKTNDQLFVALDNLEKYSYLIPGIKNKSYGVRNNLNVLKNIVGTSSVTEMQYKNNIGGEEITNSNYSSIKKKLQQIQDLKNLYYQMGMIENDLKGLGNFLKAYKDIFNGVPSIFPVLGTNLGIGYITSYFGWRRDPFNNKMRMHNGIDIVNIPGTPIVSAANGIVIKRSRGKGAGNYVAIKHKFGFKTFYMHLSSSIVQVGQRIQKGQTVGYLGNTGRSTGPHLHYEIRVNDNPIDPMPFISLDKTRHFRTIKAKKLIK